MRTLRRIGRFFRPLVVYAPLWVAWALLLALFPAPAHAQEAIAAAGRFTTLVTQLVGATALGVGGCALLIGGLGTAFGMAKAAAILRPGLILAVVMGLANRVLSFLTDNGRFILG